MSKLRTFIAVEASPGVRRRAIELIESLRTTPAKVKWASAGEMHWTLKFLGDISANDIPDLCAAMDEAVGSLEPFEIEAVGAGAFPVAARPRTIWLGVGDGQGPLIDLHDRLEVALAELGYRAEQRRFRPHLTLGRVRRSPQGIEELGARIVEQASFAAGRMPVDELVLFSSRLERTGPVHEVLARAELGGTA